jgi:hypothetical protein
MRSKLGRAFMRAARHDRDNNRFVRGVNAIEDDTCSFASLRLEITIEVIDLLHDFSFFLRKVIEQTELVDAAKQIYPHREQKTANRRPPGS